MALTSEWKFVELGDLVEFTSGGTPRKNNPSYWNGTIPWISAKNMKTERITDSSLHISYEGLHAGSKTAPNDSILFLTRGSELFNRVPICLVENDVAFNQDVKCLTPKKGVNILFVFYSLLSQVDTLLKKVESTGIGAGKFDTNVLKSLPVFLPPDDIQQEIVSLVDSISQLILINKKINHHLEQIAQAIFKSWFVNFEPWGGTVPSKWKDTTLGDLCTLISKGITPKYDDSSDQIVVNQRCIRNRSIDFSLARRHKPKVINEKWLHYGDVLINSTGEGTLGRAAQFLLNADNITADSHVTIIRPSSEELFAYIGLWCLSHEALFASMSSGSTGQTDLPREQLKLLDVMRPDIETLWNFSSTVAPLIKKRIECIRESAQLASLRDTLLPRLMSGEVSVTDLTAK